MDAQASAISQAIVDLGSSVADTEHELPRSLIAQQRDLDFQERSIADRCQRFGAIGDNGLKARSQTARQDDHRAIRQGYRLC